MFDSIAIEPRWLMVTRPAAGLADLGDGWLGAKIAHLTDLHAGRLCGAEYLSRVVETTNAASPDLIVLTGDFVTRRSAVRPELSDVLSALHAPGGKFAVLGNHDHAANPRRIQRLLEAADIEVLTNTRRILRRGGDPLCLAGVDDLRRGRPDLRAALAGVDEAVPRLLLSHNPDMAEMIPPDLRVDLLICGHTHGGQVRLPFGPPLFMPVRHRKYDAGMVQGPRCPVYVSRGIGMVGVPIRFNCRPELPVFTLRSA